LQRYLQRIIGYALTGSTREHAMFFFHGTGANGKSVLVSTVAGLMGDYHKVAPIEAFTASNTDRHPTELAMLRGARLVTATETEEGRQWAETRIKAVTGGEKIPARFMRQDFFEYVPQFKLMIAGNHKPGLKFVDEAIRRRMNLIPFAVTIPKAERDHELTEKLKSEWPAILVQIIAGCLAWQRNGLAPPPVVTNATTDYLESEDIFTQWLEECCREDANEWCAISSLFFSYRQWAEAANVNAGTQKRFAHRLAGHGFQRERRGHRREYGFIGLTVFHEQRHEQGEQGGQQRRRIWEPPF
jgi:putative DNA primase/helicase